MEVRKHSAAKAVPHKLASRIVGPYRLLAANREVAGRPVYSHGEGTARVLIYYRARMRSWAVSHAEKVAPISIIIQGTAPAPYLENHKHFMLLNSATGHYEAVPQVHLSCADDDDLVVPVHDDDAVPMPPRSFKALQPMGMKPALQWKRHYRLHSSVSNARAHEVDNLPTLRQPHQTGSLGSCGMGTSVLIAGMGGMDAPCHGRYERQPDLTSSSRPVYLYRPQAAAGVWGGRAARVFLFYRAKQRAWVVGTLQGDSFSGPVDACLVAEDTAREPTKVRSSSWMAQAGTRSRRAHVAVYCGASLEDLSAADLARVRWAWGTAARRRKEREREEAAHTVWEGALRYMGVLSPKQARADEEQREEQAEDPLYPQHAQHVPRPTVNPMLVAWLGAGSFSLMLWAASSWLRAHGRQLPRGGTDSQPSGEPERPALSLRPPSPITHRAKAFDGFQPYSLDRDSLPSTVSPDGEMTSLLRGDSGEWSTACPRTYSPLSPDRFEKGNKLRSSPRPPSPSSGIPSTSLPRPDARKRSIGIPLFEENDDDDV